MTTERPVLSAVVLFLLVLAAFSVNGCGQSSTPSPAPAPSGPTTITGSLYSGTITASAIKTASGRIIALADAPAATYTVAAVGTADKKVYFPDAKTTSTGEFTISGLPSGESFYLEVIDSTEKLAAPVSFGTSSGKVVMAVTAEAGSTSLALGKIVYDSAKGAAAPTAELDAIKDTASLATKSTTLGPVPVGAGLLGRGTGEAYIAGGSFSAKVDEDLDGLPDVVDIDDDGDGVPDGLDETPRMPGVIESGVGAISHVNAFTNLPMQYENYPTYISRSVNTSAIDITTNTTLAIEIVMESGYSPDEYSDVRISDGPAWLAAAVISSDGPAGTLWSAESYKLYKTSDRWTVHVTPNGTPAAGDALKFKLTKADSTVQYYLATLTFVFTDIPRLVAYVDSVSTKATSDLNLSVYQANSNKFDYTGSTITLKWTAPKDDTGSYVASMDYYLDGINYYNAAGAVVRTASALAVTPTSASDPTFGTVYSYVFTPTTEAFSYFKVDLKAQSPASGGGNASQMVNLKKL